MSEQVVISKRDKLKELDQKVLFAMLDCMENGEYEKLPLFSVPIQYLKANEQVSEKDKQTAGTRHKELLEEAKRKRSDASTK